MCDGIVGHTGLADIRHRSRSLNVSGFGARRNDPDFTQGTAVREAFERLLPAGHRGDNIIQRSQPCINQITSLVLATNAHKRMRAAPYRGDITLAALQLIVGRN
jgi:hypothetical protein